MGTHTVRKYLQLMEANFDIQEQIYWNACSCNERDAYVRRHALGNIDGYVKDPVLFASAEAELNNLAEAFVETCGFIHQSDYKKVMANTRPKIRGRYQRAYTNITLNRQHFVGASNTAKAFVKYEKIAKSKWEDGKAPRLIQHRTFEFLYIMKSLFLEFSLGIKQKKDELMWNDQSIGSIFAKLHDQPGVAKILKDNWDSFNDPVALCLDHSSFDGHVNLDLIDLAAKFWRKIHGRKTRILDLFLKALRKCKVTTKNGVRVLVIGTRLSGEYITSDENTILNYIMLSVWLKEHGVTEFKITVNGDDSVVFINAEDVRKLVTRDEEMSITKIKGPRLAWFRKFNMETELGKVTSTFGEIDFCQSSPIRACGNWTMVKEPIRAMSRACYAPYEYVKIIERYLAGTGLCNLACYSGVPVLQAFALRMIELSGQARPLGSVEKDAALNSQTKRSVIQPVTDEARADFEISFGIGDYEQRWFESMAATQDPNLVKYISKYENFALN